MRTAPSACECRPAFCVRQFLPEPLSLTVVSCAFRLETPGFMRFARHHPEETTYILLGGCCLALAYNIVLMQSVPPRTLRRHTAKPPFPAVLPSSPPHCPAAAPPHTQVRSLSSVGTAVLGNFRTVLLIFMSALILGELKDWNSARWVGCVNTFIGAAAYGLHPKVSLVCPLPRFQSPGTPAQASCPMLHPQVCGTPVTREMSMSATEVIAEAKLDAAPEEKVLSHPYLGRHVWWKRPNSCVSVSWPRQCAPLTATGDNRGGP